MKRWGVRARNINILIVMSLFGVFVVQALMVSRNIAQYESQGLGPSNDLGQRGLLVGVVVVLVAWGLAAFSNSGLAKTRASGFVLHSLLWLVLLVVVSVLPLPAPLQILGVTLCVAGVGYGIGLAATTVRSSRIERRRNE